MEPILWKFLNSECKGWKNHFIFFQKCIEFFECLNWCVFNFKLELNYIADSWRNLRFCELNSCWFSISMLIRSRLSRFSDCFLVFNENRVIKVETSDKSAPTSRNVIFRILLTRFGRKWQTTYKAGIKGCLSRRINWRGLFMFFWFFWKKSRKVWIIDLVHDSVAVVYFFLFIHVYLEGNDIIYILFSVKITENPTKTTKNLKISLFSNVQITPYLQTLTSQFKIVAVIFNTFFMTQSILASTLHWRLRSNTNFVYSNEYYPQSNGIQPRLVGRVVAISNEIVVMSWFCCGLPIGSYRIVLSRLEATEWYVKIGVGCLGC